MVNISLDLPLSITYTPFFSPPEPLTLSVNFKLSISHFMLEYSSSVSQEQGHGYVTTVHLPLSGAVTWYNSMSKICMYSNIPRCSQNVLCISFSSSGSGQGADVASSYVCFESVSRSVMSNSLLPHGSLPASSVHEILQVRILGVGSHFLLQGIFVTQGSNPGLPHCRQILYHLSYVCFSLL